jgi:hypothetical protein
MQWKMHEENNKKCMKKQQKMRDENREKCLKKQ